MLLSSHILTTHVFQRHQCFMHHMSTISLIHQVFCQVTSGFPVVPVGLGGAWASSEAARFRRASGCSTWLGSTGGTALAFLVCGLFTGVKDVGGGTGQGLATGAVVTTSVLTIFNGPVVFFTGALDGTCPPLAGVGTGFTPEDAWPSMVLFLKWLLNRSCWYRYWFRYQFDCLKLVLITVCHHYYPAWWCCK